MELQVINSTSEPENLSDYKFIQYAIKNFRKECPFKHTRGSLKRSLLYHDNSSNSETAMTVFIAIQRFMMDLPEPRNLAVLDEEDNVFMKTINRKRDHYPGTTFNRKIQSVKKPNWSNVPPLTIMAKPTTNMEKVRFICRYGIFRQELRDEIYCQLCKQLSANPSRTSSSRGWILMALCLGCFPPSDKFVNYLRCFLKEGPYGYGDYCMKKLRRTLEIGNRRQTPTWVELQAAKAEAKIVLPITLMDGSTHECEVDSATTCKELCQIIKEKIGLKSEFGFSIFAAVIDQITNWGCGDESLLDSVSLCEQYALYKGHSEGDTTIWRIYMRKNVFMPSQSPGNDPVETDLIYAQIIGGVQLGEYVCRQTSDLADIIAKRYYIEHGSEVNDTILRELVKSTTPDHLLESDKNIVDEIIGLVEGSFETIPIIRNKSSAQIVKQNVVSIGMKTWALEFSRKYDANLILGPKVPKGDVILAVNSGGVLFLSAQSNGSKAFFFSLEYPHLETVSTESRVRRSGGDDSVYFISFITSQKKTYTLRTAAAEEIKQLVVELMTDFKSSDVGHGNNNI